MPRLVPICDERRHLVCWPYSEENLHAVAQYLGVKRHWYHGGRHPHYDIPKRMEVDIMGQCVILPSREVLLVTKGVEPYGGRLGHDMEDEVGIIIARTR